jgi:hypothetical protein
MARAKKTGVRRQASGVRPKKKAGVRRQASGVRPKKKAKPAAKKVKAKAKKAAAAPRKRSARLTPDARRLTPLSDAIPEPLPPLEDTSGRRTLTARERLGRSSPVVEILDDEHPTGALRRFLDSVKGEATEQQAQIALGAAQLMLLPIALEHRGGTEVKELVDLLLERWNDFGARRHGFHAQEFLRNAFAAIGVDRDRIAALEDRVPPHASTELRFNIACAHAVARDKVAMLRAIESAIEHGASTSKFRSDPDFAPYLSDPDFVALLAHADVPPIPVDIAPHVIPVREALDSLVSTLRELGMRVELRPPVRLDAILDAERARKISLPNDYRALLTISNRMDVWEQKFFAAGDFREPTKLAVRAQHFLQSTSETELAGCIPLASWGQANDWLVYDPRGHARSGEPGYVLVAGADEVPLAGLVAALARIEHTARDVLGTN